MMKIGDYIMIEEAAVLLGVTPNTLRNWEKMGKIKVYRNPLNKFRLYRLKDLHDILDSIQTLKKE